jgi:hypothetical protein
LELFVAVQYGEVLSGVAFPVVYQTSPTP